MNDGIQKLTIMVISNFLFVISGELLLKRPNMLMANETVVCLFVCSLDKVLITSHGLCLWPAILNP